MNEAIRGLETKKQFLPDGGCVELLEEAIALLKIQHNYIVELETSSTEIQRLIRDFKIPA